MFRPPPLPRTLRLPPRPTRRRTVPRLRRRMRRPSTSVPRDTSDGTPPPEPANSITNATTDFADPSTPATTDSNSTRCVARVFPKPRSVPIATDLPWRRRKHGSANRRREAATPASKGTRDGRRETDVENIPGATREGSTAFGVAKKECFSIESRRGAPSRMRWSARKEGPSPPPSPRRGLPTRRLPTSSAFETTTGPPRRPRRGTVRTCRSGVGIRRWNRKMERKGIRKAFAFGWRSWRCDSRCGYDVCSWRTDRLTRAKILSAMTPSFGCERRGPWRRPRALRSPSQRKKYQKLG